MSKVNNKYSKTMSLALLWCLYLLTLNIFLVFLLLTLNKQMPSGKASYHLVKFVEGSHSGSKVIMILVCHLISLDHVIKGSYDFIGWSPSW